MSIDKMTKLWKDILQLTRSRGLLLGSVSKTVAIKSALRPGGEPGLLLHKTGIEVPTAKSLR